MNFNFFFFDFFVLPVLLLERGGWTVLVASKLHILSGLSRTQKKPFRQDRPNGLMGLEKVMKPKISNLVVFFGDN